MVYRTGGRGKEFGPLVRRLLCSVAEQHRVGQHYDQTEQGQHVDGHLAADRAPIAVLHGRRMFTCQYAKSKNLIEWVNELVWYKDCCWYVGDMSVGCMWFRTKTAGKRDEGDEEEGGAGQFLVNIHCVTTSHSLEKLLNSIKFWFPPPPLSCRSYPVTSFICERISYIKIHSNHI